MGGAIYLGTRAVDGIQLFLTNTTISGNSATLGGGALAFDLAEGANAYFNFSTIAYNTTSTAGAGGGIRTVPPSGNDGQFVLLSNSIIAGNTAAGAPSNCVGPANFSGSGDSIESTNSCGLNTSNSMINTDPQLAPLATSFGGEQTTRTHGLYDSSPAVDFFPASLGQCAGITIDQRYALRPLGDGCDIGAFEGSVGPAPPPLKCGGRTATRTGTAGRDVIKGTKDVDVIVGFGGPDKILGRGGKDFLCGGTGNDELLGGGGPDKLFGQAGRDLLRGGAGKDRLKGGKGKDRQVQ
ncbi:MAG: calcium-binding protein [Solirubrobacterales bacterium]|nr:calcium-binding protein [Solirubrobacterales bacterium]